MTDRIVLKYKAKDISALTFICAVHQIDLIPNHGHYQLLVDVQQGDLGEELLKTNQSDQIRVTCEGWRA